MYTKFDTITMVVATDMNNAIGYNNTLPWRQSNDLARFKVLTEFKTVLMGRKTFESIGSKPLKNRFNYVLTRHPEKYENLVNLKFIKSIDELKNNNQEINDLVIIGGGEIYEKFQFIVDRIYLTKINTKLDKSDAHFFEIDENLFDIETSNWYAGDGENNQHNYQYITYIRKEENK